MKTELTQGLLLISGGSFGKIYSDPFEPIENGKILHKALIEIGRLLYWEKKFEVYTIYCENFKVYTRRVPDKEIKAELKKYILNGGKFENAVILEDVKKFLKIPVDMLAAKKAPAKKRKQTGTSNKAFDKQRKAKPVGKRTSASGKEYIETRANRSDVDRRKRL